MTQATRFSSLRTSNAARPALIEKTVCAGADRFLPFARPKTTFVTVALLAVVVGLCAALAFDVQAILAARALPSWVRQIAAWITLLGLSNYMLVVSALLALGAALVARRPAWGQVRPRAFRVRNRAAFFFAAVAGSGVAAQIVKHVLGRARPKLFDTLGAFHFDLFAAKASFASLPSGHATSAFAAATALGVMLPRARGPLFALACLVAASRVVVGAHYVSDVIAGAALGFLFTIGLSAFCAARGWVFEWRGDGLVLLDGGETHNRSTGTSRLEPSA